MVVGAVAGAFGAGVRLQRENPQAVVDRLPGVRAFMAALPAEARVKVRQELVASWQESRDLRRAAGQARRDAFAAAATEPYDVARVRAAFARLRAADQAAIGVFHDNVADAFGAMTPEERRAARCRETENLRAALACPADLLILDEACAAWQLDMVDPALLRSAVLERPAAQELVLTGREPAEWMRQAADYVTEMHCWRHPYEKGIAARRGVEF